MSVILLCVYLSVSHVTRVPLWRSNIKHIFLPLNAEQMQAVYLLYLLPWLLFAFTYHRTSYFRHTDEIHFQCAVSHAGNRSVLSATICAFFFTESSDCTKVLQRVLKPFIHFSTARLGKRLVSQQIQVSAWSKHFTSHFTPGPTGGTISVSPPRLH